MSKKSDLLVRVRYLNPLPNPPFPPKLLNVSTDINRLGEPSYLDPLAASTPLPMLVDSEMGMPLDLNAYDGVWEGKEESLNPQLDAGRVHHPIDVALLAPFNAPPAINGDAKPALTTDVSWMRNSSYLTRKNNAKRREAAESSQSYDILPDDDSWPNSYMIIRFPERPTAATALNPAAGASSPRLAKAIMRPVVDDEQQMMEFYLPQEEHLAKLDDAYERAVDKEPLENILALSAEDPLDPKIDEVFPNAVYDRIRTYEVVSANPPSKEVLVAFQEDDEETDRPNKRRKGVYYKQITFRTLLRKTRAKVETRGDLWDKTRVGFRIPEEREVEDRQTARGQVQDPTWASAELRRLHGGDNMAEGQGEAIDDEELVDEGAQQAEAALDDVDED
ncbi:hypothetical protein CI109_103564 [Kwoniella shandongensis]|uniref:RNA polymerase II-associated factor 1 n=1 Tax=Kwoniella shandongensis TaxID=1734106 RepID=A0AAJ8MXV3_9TREE